MRIRNVLPARLAGRAAVGLLRLICSTCRLRMDVVEGTSLYHAPQECFLYSAWHDAIVLSLLIRRPARNMAALVSQHRDGDYVASLLDSLGILPVRGSTTRGGTRALRELIRVTRENHVAITSDGPRGPRRKVKPGLVYLAAKTGRRIVPAGYACARGWNLRGSWTDMAVPRPFTTVYVVGGQPISVPEDVDREGIAHFTRRLQDDMDDVNARAAAYARGTLPFPGGSCCERHHERSQNPFRSAA